jgi:5'-nucleotidase
MGAASRDASDLVHRLLAAKSGPCLLNVNYPPEGDWRKVATVSGRRVYSGGLDVRTDPRGRHYYWIGGDSVQHENEPGTDTEAFDAGQIGVTQLMLSLSIVNGAAAASVCTGAPEG